MTSYTIHQRVQNVLWEWSLNELFGRQQEYIVWFMQVLKILKSGCLQVRLKVTTTERILRIEFNFKGI